MPNNGANKLHLIISEDKEESIANMFVFGAFADKNNKIVYHDLTGLFPFMSLDSSVCFFVLYHYKSNCILNCWAQWHQHLQGVSSKKIQTKVKCDR